MLNLRAGRRPELARIRSVKPSIWTDEKFISLSRDARLLVLGMISHADDEGRLMASIPRLAGDIFPADELKPGQLRRWRDEASATGMVVIYLSAGVEYAVFPNWSKHQRISKPQPSTLPVPPPDVLQSRNGSAPSRGTVPHPVAEQSGNDSAPEAKPRARAVGDRRQETGVPTTSDAGKPRREKREPPSEAHVGTVVAAFVDGATEAGLKAPPSNLRARIGKQARQLLAEGWDIAALIASARTVGAGEWNDLAVQARKDDAAANGRGRPSDAPGPDRARGWMAAGRAFQEDADQAGKELPQ